MKTSHIHQTTIPLKSVLTAHFPRKKHYRVIWKSTNNVQNIHIHCIPNPKGLEVNGELAGRTKKFSLSVFLDTIFLNHLPEEQRLKTVFQRAGLVPYLQIFLQLFEQESYSTFHRPSRGASTTLPPGAEQGEKYFQLQRSWPQPSVWWANREHPDRSADRDSCAFL